MRRATGSWSELPLGAIRPSGWLADQLRLQASGLTGRLEEVWPDVGPDSEWLGGTGENWERGPYYVDGLLPLAHVLDDAQLRARAEKWVEAILGSQRADGQFGPKSNEDWWPRMVALKVLIQHADATDDERVAPFLERYFRYQLEHLPDRPLASWGAARGAENALAVYWLYRRTQESWLADLGRLLLAQTSDWVTFLGKELTPGPTRQMQHLKHCVNVAMGLKKAAVEYLFDSQESHRAETRDMFASLDRLHGLVHGVFSGDEWLAGREPHHGVETCQVVELMRTLEEVTAIFADGSYGDLLEQVAYNLLPASNDPRMLAHQYHQQANQVLVSFAQRDWTYSGIDANVFGLEPQFGCCTANYHQGWPKLVRSSWLETSDGLAAVTYAPCTVSTAIGDQPVRLSVLTTYPFEETVEISVETPNPTEFTLHLRIPGWCSEATLEVAGEAIAVRPDERGYQAVRRQWKDGDRVRLVLPMRPRTVARDKGAVGVRLGPLVMALGVKEVWRPVPDHPGPAEWEITPRSAWNIGLWLDDPARIDTWEVERRPVAAVPFTAADAPVVVKAKGAPIPEWTMVANSAGPLPQSPVAANLPIHQVLLIPYGCARLRVAELPVITQVEGAEDDTGVHP
ncbi:beta-L-arabinofuranosidase domain-containing protein [Amycolatopsis jejuensis]|uniref:beta-L-arabinofuranosidase domain-containing protein n=1 Tax=Amycolatopsis jejuensis TaxID=330084 RepID=UPI000524F7F7|nr:beta-L-arabinofuranosidase domain-containing protein [Amycolatopsis jejuensis]